MALNILSQVIFIKERHYETSEVFICGFFLFPVGLLYKKERQASGRG